MNTWLTPGNSSPELQTPDINEQFDGDLTGFLRDVDEELNTLVGRTNRFEKAAIFWYCIAAIAMVLGMVYAYYRAKISSKAIEMGNLKWEGVVLSLASGLIVVALLGGIARFAYVMGKSFMVESIRNNNRRHAIKFGRGYISAFRHNLPWPIVKDVFGYWNIDIGSSFLTQAPEDIDPQLIQGLVALGKTLIEKATKKE